MSGAGQTLYLKLPQNSIVSEEKVRLCDIARLECSDVDIRRAVRQMEIWHFGSDGKQNRTQVISVLYLIERIHRDYPELEIVSLGAPDFVVRYEPSAEKYAAQYLKVAVVCVILFFGGAFTIMTFFQDVAVGDVFDRFYLRVTGVTPAGVTPLEVSFCVGIAVGIMLFYNHVGRKKITDDPTPIQTAMRKYEQDVDTAYIEASSRKGKNIDVDN
ncbi:MAG: stage V sporulation protein AA [Lachnospiraceae bacterium]|nr:stage V sporulation protein AA [Lachnospiraceae bacterium]